MITLVFFLEEPSTAEMLKGVLPKIISDNIDFRFIIFEGKQDLEKQVERRLKLWRKPDCRFIILRDQDSGDCRGIKRNLLDKCNKARHPDTIIRIACHELESF